ncbi:SDR family NAD(P)-dependent oxidoreductase [Streptomyces sp. NPDC051555]|uniref:SDR family NAD(P)-dependent oxidoreductase n=1 Tax=Streptomyces sp. NPDC051555 TaxID=3365657 RepID=UPI00378C7638
MAVSESPVFTETFTVTSENPLLHGHVVYGRPLLPGVGYVDLVLQVLARHGHAMPDVELRNLTILAPLVAAPGERVQTTIEGRPSPRGGWRIEVRSRREQDAADVLHAVVAAHRREPTAFTERLALPLDGVTGATPVTDIYRWCREHDLQHSGMMKISGQVHHRSGDWIAELELAPEYHGTTEAFLFHPALFEAGLLGGGIAIGMLHGDDDGPGLYLPLMFEEFRATGPLGKRVFVRVPAESVRRDEELIRLVVEFYDETGHKVAEVGRFVAKRVRAQSSLDVRETPAPEPVSAPVAVALPESVSVPVPVPVPAPVVVAEAVRVGGGGDFVSVLRDLVAVPLGRVAADVEVDLGYYDLGLASADLLALVAELEDRLGVPLSPTVMFEYRTITELAAWLEEEHPDRALSPEFEPEPVSVSASVAVALPVPDPVPVPVPVVVAEAVRVGGGGDFVSVLRDLVAVPLGRVAADVEVDLGYYDLGLASADLLALVAELEDRLGVPLSPTVMFEYRTITELAAWLEEEHPDRAPAPEAPATVEAPAVVEVRVPLDHAAGPLAVVTEEVAALLSVTAAEVDPDAELAEFGLDWTGLAQLAGRLTARYGRTVEPTVFSRHRTVRAVAAHLDSAVPATVPATVPAAGHPMLQRPVPDAAGEGDRRVTSYETHFTGEEPYLKDHQVRGVRVLPGVAHLEMARAAVARTLGEEHADRVHLEDVVWLSPATSGTDGLDLRVTVRALPGGAVHAYEIHALGADDEPTLCSAGRASLRDAGRTRTRTLPSLAEVRAACTGTPLSAADVYGHFTAMGLEYGPTQRTLVALATGTDAAGRRQVLAELRLAPTADPLPGVRLHPAIADGALQASMGLWLTGGPAGEGRAALALPFALQQAATPAATTDRAWAWVRHQPDSAAEAADGSVRLDVTLYDEHGRVCADLSGLSSRRVPAGSVTAGAPAPAAEPAQGEAPVAARAAAPAPAVTDIAIVGVSGRYPEAPDLDAFWDNLRAGRDSVREVPADRWDHRRYTEASGRTAGTWGGFLDGIDEFDPLFFQISMLEADYLDPQERLFLQCAHHALEDAGYTGRGLSGSGRVGVFVGVMYQEYQLFGAQAQERGKRTALWGSASTIANRVSYFHDFRGPSLAVDTMCSSSLTSLHLACEAIRSGQCEAAIAGGVNLSPHPNKFMVLAERHFLSSDGRCRSFGEGGDGYVPGEGVGAVVLKPLDRAIADGDQIYGVIKGTAVNHGGRTGGYSVPTPVAQGEVIAEAIAASGVDPRALSYLEAHGTGTSLGDPIEIAGLQKALRQAGGGPGHLAIGSVKSNIGHCESAAGIAAVTKVLLQLKHGELVPSLHSRELNPHIDFDRTPLHVQQEVEPWRRPVLEVDGEQVTFPRIAGVSSFGGGGSNAHVVIAEHLPTTPRPVRSAADGRPALLVLSAMSEAQLVEQARRLSARLGELTDADLGDAARTLQSGRTALDERLAFAAASRAEAVALLESFAGDPRRPDAAWTRGTVRADRDRDGRALAEAVAQWSESGAYERLLGLWADGAAVDWEAAHAFLPPARRISLPGYPFARDLCRLGEEILGVPLHQQPHQLARQSAQQPAERPRPPVATARPESDDTDEVLLLRPVWTDRACGRTPSGTPQGNPDPAEFAARHVVVIGRLDAADREAFEAALPAQTRCRFLEPVEGSPAQQYTDLAGRLFGVVRELLERGVRRPELLQVVLVGDAGQDADRDPRACFGGLGGLLRTARLENPRLRTQFVECLDGAAPAAVAARLIAEAVPDPEPEVRHRGGRRLVAELAELTGPRPAARPWRSDGVYLITGGAGGLGLIVAREIAASAAGATVVLTGRSPLDADRREDLRTLREAGLTVDYQRADVADREALARLLAHVADNHGPLTGIVHSAGVVADNFVVRKSPEELERVLAPKVAGLVHLDELTRDQPLEAFLCFSSISGTFGNPGQADYAAANGFMDAYAAHRNHLVGAGLRRGHTVSVAWPLWDEGGMGADAAVRDHLAGTGLTPLDTPRGLAALRVAQDPRQNGLDTGRLLVVSGRREQLPAGLTGRTAPTATAPAPAAGTPGATAPAEGAPVPETDGSLEERTVGHLRRQLATALGLRPERLAVDKPLERYGMDSVLAVNFVSGLEDSFGPLPRTLLFEVQTVRGLARHLLGEHPAELRALLGEPPAPSGAQQPTPAAAPEPAPAPAAVPRQPQQPHVAEPRTTGARTEGTRTGARTAEADRDLGGDRDRDRDRDAIAIIGITGRYPDAPDLDTFWANLRSGRDSVTEVPADRWDHEQYSGAPDTPGTSRGKWGAFLDGIDRFDPLHFGISPREAAVMDPQQRLFLETVWHLFEQSGVTQEVIERRHGRRVGVYVGSAYQMYRAEDTEPALAALTASSSYNMIANRVSHFFGLEGPSLAVDSMCTSSAMAVHLACADLLRGESELAVAGGVNLTVHPDKYVALSEMQFLGSHPGSRSFRDGDGYLPAEGVGAVLLKPLAAARRDGDTVLAVIRGTASLHSGRSNGFMTPSHRSMVKVMRQALDRAGVAPGSIGYVEAAANGTTFSDEVEVGALREVFAAADAPVAVGTVKSNLGHPEAASGIAQLTKVVLQLHHRELAPLVEAGEPNANLDLAAGPLVLCDALTAWEPRGAGGTSGAPGTTSGRPERLLALVNSVAAGGSHVSLVVEEAPQRASDASDAGDAGDVREAGPQLVVVSARHPEGLRTAAQRLHDHLGTGPLDLADLAWTTQVGREALPERLAVVAGSAQELRDALAHHLAADVDGLDAPADLATVHRGNADEDGGPFAAVISGPRGEALLAGLAADGDLENLARLWVHGATVAWPALHRGPRRLVRLPATAFETGRYWVGRTPAGAPAPVPAAPASGAVPAADQGRADAESLMASAWAELLQIEPSRLGGASNFFSLGGNSLLATRLINLIKQRTGVELPVQAVFDAPKLTVMAAELRRRLPAARPAAAIGAADVNTILESLSRIENMTDDELDALGVGN